MDVKQLPGVCCGNLLTSRYCPDCGKSFIETNSLLGLLHHCDRHAELQKRRASSGRGSRANGHQAQMDAATLKWESWAGLLAMLITKTSQREIIE